MRKAIHFMLMSTLACGIAVGQSSLSGDDKDKHDHMSSGETKTMTGCVKERDGRYWLMDKKHPIGIALNSTEDLKAHEGHKVSVTGTVSPLDQAQAEKAMEKYPEHKGSTPDNPLRTTKKDREEKHEMKHGLQMMDLTNLQMESEKCKMK